MIKFLKDIVSKGANLPESDFNHKLKELQKEIEESDSNYTPPVNHYFGHKCYGREMFASKGSVVIGKIHKYKTINILTEGEVTIVTETGISKFKAPCVLESEPGVQKVGYFHEDSTWITFHGTKSKQVKKIEKELFTVSYSDLRPSIKERLKGFFKKDGGLVCQWQ